MAEESVIIVAYALVVFMPFLIAAWVVKDCLNTHGTHYADEKRLASAYKKEQSFND